MAFSDDMIRAVVAAGQYSDTAAAEHLATILMNRRDAIGRAFLPAVNPIVEPALDRAGQLTFRSAAVDAQLAESPRGYSARWFSFNNDTGMATEIGTRDSVRSPIAAPSLPPARFLKVELRAVGAPVKAWETPISVYFRSQNGSWSLVGLDRLPDSF